MSGKITEGWGGPGLSKKFHYFIDSRSLCAAWLFMGELTPHKPTETVARRDDCKTCFKKLLKRVQNGVKPEEVSAGTDKEP